MRFVSDAEMKRLNGRFRKKAEDHGRAFVSRQKIARGHGVGAMSAMRKVRGAFLGDIAISPTVAGRNAKAFGRSMPEEICVLMLHGVLHLLGYDHETDRGEMERVEAALRASIGAELMLLWTYVGSLLVLALGLPIFSYLTLIYRELGRMTTGRVHEHLEIFEAEIEPKLKINRRSGGRTFRILGHFWLAFVVLETTRGVVYLVPNRWEAGAAVPGVPTLEVVIAMHFVPDMLLYRTTGRWLLAAVAAGSRGHVACLADSRFPGRGGIAGAHFGAGSGTHRRAAHGRGN